MRSDARDTADNHHCPLSGSKGTWITVVISQDSNFGPKCCSEGFYCLQELCGAAAAPTANRANEADELREHPFAATCPFHLTPHHCLASPPPTHTPIARQRTCNT